MVSVLCSLFQLGPSYQDKTGAARLQWRLENNVQLGSEFDCSVVVVRYCYATRKKKVLVIVAEWKKHLKETSNKTTSSVSNSATNQISFIRRKG